MRALPCLARCVGQSALAVRGPVPLVHSAGTLVETIQYTCRRCGYPTRLTPAQFSRLPLATVTELLSPAFGFNYEVLNDPKVAEERDF